VAKTRRPEFHIHIQPDKEVLVLLNKILEILMAESPEVAAFRARVETALANVSADIQRILARATGLSTEDKAALDKIATDLESLASVVPES